MHHVEYGQTFTGGRVALPPSKSAAIRAMLCAALAKGESRLLGMAGEHSQDVASTIQAIKLLGAKCQLIDGELSIQGSPSFPAASSETSIVDCGESGALSRFLIPIAAAVGGHWRFTGHGRLPKRPLGVYLQLLPEHGVEILCGDGLPLEFRGRLTPGKYTLPGNISSQFITGLMFALPLLSGESYIELSSPLESSGYVDMTVHSLSLFGITVQRTESGWYVPDGQSFRPCRLHVEGDWSHAAFFLNLAALSPHGAQVRLAGLLPDSLQGDKACVEVFGGFGLNIRWDGDELLAENPRAAEPFGGLKGQILDVSEITDMVPAAAVCAALSQGETRFLNAARLRLKESDRLSAMCSAINTLGGHAKEEGDSLIINGAAALRGGLVNGQNDHRVLMALCAAGLRSQSPVTVTDAWSIKKTYPDFYSVFRSLGGNANVIKLG